MRIMGLALPTPAPARIDLLQSVIMPLAEHFADVFPDTVPCTGTIIDMIAQESYGWAACGICLQPMVLTLPDPVNRPGFVAPVDASVACQGSTNESLASGSCRHAFHDACLHQYVAMRVREGAITVVCPEPGCGQAMLPMDIRRHLGPELAARYNEVVVSVHRHRNAVLEPEVQAMIDAGDARPCPSCRTVLVHDGGCAMMACRVCARMFEWSEPLAETDACAALAELEEPGRVVVSGAPPDIVMYHRSPQYTEYVKTVQVVTQMARMPVRVLRIERLLADFRRRHTELPEALRRCSVPAVAVTMYSSMEMYQCWAQRDLESLAMTVFGTSYAAWNAAYGAGEAVVRLAYVVEPHGVMLGFDDGGKPAAWHDGLRSLWPQPDHAAVLPDAWADVLSNALQEAARDHPSLIFVLGDGVVTLPPGFADFCKLENLAVHVYHNGEMVSLLAPRIEIY